MKLSIYKLLLGCVAVFGLAAVGCEDQVTMSDVDAARDEVKDEAADVREAEDEARDEITEEQDDVDAVAREEREEIEEQRDELADAQADLAEVEQEFVNQEQRKAYIDKHETALADVDRRLDTFETDAGNLDDDAVRESREAELEGVRSLYNDANDKFGELDAIDEDGWKTEHSAFARAFAQLQTAMSKLAATGNAVIDPALDPVTPAPIVP